MFPETRRTTKIPTPSAMAACVKTFHNRCTNTSDENNKKKNDDGDHADAFVVAVVVVVVFVAMAVWKYRKVKMVKGRQDL